MSLRQLTVGFDIGSVSINTVICSPSGELIDELPYRRHFGRTIDLCAQVLSQVETRYGSDSIARVVFTGTHGKTMAEATGTFFEIETTAQTRGLFHLFPEARSVISIGGHDSTLLVVKPSREGFLLQDFKLNEACAAGTGSFIDQQAERIFADFPEFKALSDPQARMEAILARFIEEGASSDRPTNVACRCTVFTKSDMIHLQNKGIAIRHIIAGLHEGVAKNFKSTMITNRRLEGPVAFIGGYATNTLARKAFETILRMPVSVPVHHTVIGACGVALAAIAANAGRAVRSQEIQALKDSAAFAAATTPPLCLKLAPFTDCGQPLGLPNGSGEIEAYMGFDIGSTTTKLVVITPGGSVLYKCYIPTEGQPVVAIKKAMRHLMSTIDTGRVKILAIGATGSGREPKGFSIPRRSSGSHPGKGVGQFLMSASGSFLHER